MAIPYLDRFQTVADIIPAIRHPLFMGFALYHVGRKDEAIVALRQERNRLKKLDPSNRDVVTLSENVDRRLAFLEAEAPPSRTAGETLELPPDDSVKNSDD